MLSKNPLLELLGLVIGTLILVACVPENANNVDSYYQKEYKYNEVKDSVDGQNTGQFKLEISIGLFRILIE